MKTVLITGGAKRLGRAFKTLSTTLTMELNLSKSIADETNSALARYLSFFPDERPDLSKLLIQLSEGGESVHSRANMQGHVTVSALVLDPTLRCVLVIRHPVFDMLLPPGGHVEAGCNNLWDAAMDEVAQETGLKSALPYGRFSLSGTPIDIDTHAIAGNPKKNEGDHLHHDFMYLAVSTVSYFSPQPDVNDAVKDAFWMPLLEFGQLPSLRLNRVAGKIRI